MRDLPLMNPEGWALTPASSALLTPVPPVPPQPLQKNEIMPQ